MKNKWFASWGCGGGCCDDAEDFDTRQEAEDWLKNQRKTGFLISPDGEEWWYWCGEFITNKEMKERLHEKNK